LADDFDDDDSEDDSPDDDQPRPREPWREVVATPDALGEWLRGRLRWTLNDTTSVDWSDHARRADVERESTHSRREFADRLLAAFPPQSSRYFVGGHAGWDQWYEDYLSRDEVIAVATADTVAVLWLYFYRWYG
jgi:hypothetical protein